MELPIWAIFMIIVVCLALIFIAFQSGIKYRQKVAEAKIGGAETKAKEVIDDALKAADAKKREILLEAKEDALKIKNDMENEVRERRGEVQRAYHGHLAAHGVARTGVHAASHARELLE